MTAATVQQRLTDLFAKTSTTALIDSLLILKAGEMTAETRWAHAQTINELERRHPAAGEAVEAAYDAAEAEIEAGRPGEVDYVTVLVAAVRGELASAR